MVFFSASSWSKQVKVFGLGFAGLPNGDVFGKKHIDAAVCICMAWKDHVQGRIAVFIGHSQLQAARALDRKRTLY